MPSSALRTKRGTSVDLCQEAQFVVVGLLAARILAGFFSALERIVTDLSLRRVVELPFTEIAVQPSARPIADHLAPCHWWAARLAL